MELFLVEVGLFVVEVKLVVGLVVVQVKLVVEVKLLEGLFVVQVKLVVEVVGLFVVEGRVGLGSFSWPFFWCSFPFPRSHFPPLT